MTSLEHWLARLDDALGTDVPPEIVAPLLDLARDAAHAVARPAAPLTAFVVGYAAGRTVPGRFDPATVLALIDRAAGLANGEVPIGG
ncbi:DUF6457 domain-containing protein [Leifsonia shinshuensis]|uniref:DUF6457 domain-containing protein n=1 Tax=Leifsonia shinshuensis TaxID=150026 RepID=UPI002863C57B|nr:DUF6457 domain-containing protein [Leifsonia shinshuensis]MDR6972074.1 hypothetical protein [Leifsonia shinshuensis]